MSAGVMVAALAIEAAVGWPDVLYRRIGHPVSWLGAIIAWADDGLNRPSRGHRARYAAGAFTTVLVVAAVFGAATLLSASLPDNWVGRAVEAALAASLLASRSLHDHVAAVAAPLGRGDLEGGRYAVARIVGRDPTSLDAPGVARAAIESLAENMSDGVIAPLFWGVLLGLPGLAAYKAVNTLDSMIGHRSEKHLAFGGFAARLDDVANLVPARLTGVLLTVAAPSLHALRAMARDAPRHRSPNAGWPEAAMAGALGVRLSGPRSYQGITTTDPWINSGAPDPDAAAIDRALGLYIRALLLAAGFLFVLASA